MNCIKDELLAGIKVGDVVKMKMGIYNGEYGNVIKKTTDCVSFGNEKPIHVRLFSNGETVKICPNHIEIVYSTGIGKNTIENDIGDIHVGDVVTLIDDIRIGVKYGGVVAGYINQSWKGKDVTVTHIDDDGDILTSEAGEAVYFSKLMVRKVIPAKVKVSQQQVTLSGIANVKVLGKKVTVTLDSQYKGSASCSPTDIFDESKGIEIASLRAFKKEIDAELKKLTT